MGCCCSRSHTAKKSFNKTLAVAIKPIKKDIEKYIAKGKTHVTIEIPDVGLHAALLEYLTDCGYIVVPGKAIDIDDKKEKDGKDDKEDKTKKIKDVWRIYWAPVIPAAAAAEYKELGVSIQINPIVK